MKLIDMRKDSSHGYIVAAGFRDFEGDTILTLYCSEDNINAEYNFGKEKGAIVEAFQMLMFDYDGGKSNQWCDSLIIVLENGETYWCRAKTDGKI